MPELLVELGCEPLPLWAQNGEAPKELARRLCAGLKEKGLLGEDALEPSIFVTPLRLAFRIPGVAEHAPERMEEKRGPREGSPDKAVMGFMRSAGLTSIEDLELRESKDRKGKFWFANIKVASQPAEALIPEIIVEAIRQLPWQKTMRWEANGFRWPRALYRYLVLLGDKPLSLASVAASLPQDIEGGKAETLDTHGNLVPVSSPKDWQTKLETRGITLSFEERCEYIMYHSPFEEIMPDLASMTEAPRAVRVFLDGAIVDGKISQLSVHGVVSQVLEGELKSVFEPEMGEDDAGLMFVAEAPPGEGGVAQDSLPADWETRLQDAVRRVAYARLADVQFYWERDEAKGLDKLHESLKDIRYHLRLGSLYERSERLALLSRFVAQKPYILKEIVVENVRLQKESEGRNAGDSAEEAGRYAQADLASETIRAFPKQAGHVSSALYLSREALAGDIKADNTKSSMRADVLMAMATYRDKPHPLNAPYKVKTALFLRVAHHTDALVGLWAAGERATGSGDPFAMRRHALYLSGTLLNDLFKDFSLHDAIEESARLYRAHSYTEADFSSQNLEELKQFIFKRIKYAMSEGSGIPHDITQAAIYSAVRQKDGVVFRMLQSARALHRQHATKIGKNLQAAWVRASGLAKGFDPDKKFVVAPDSAEEEKALSKALELAERSIQDESLVIGQMNFLLLISPLINNFLDNVRVLEGTQAEQENRLALLRQFMDTVRLVADFDYLEGGKRAAPPPPASKPPRASKPSDATPSAPRV